VLETVFGRAYDFVISPSGKKYHAEFLMYVFEEAKRREGGISQFQVRQLQLDHIEVVLVPSASYTDQVGNRVVDRISELMKHEVNVSLRLEKQIQRERSGKMRVIVGLKSLSSLESESKSTCAAPVKQGVH